LRGGIDIRREERRWLVSWEGEIWRLEVSTFARETAGAEGEVVPFCRVSGQGQRAVAVVIGTVYAKGDEG
jgi:hypothetical protein